MRLLVAVPLTVAAVILANELADKEARRMAHLRNIPNVGKEPLHYIFEKQLVSTTGLVLEFGVFQGTSINYIASQTSSQVYGFDSFEGLPEDWGRVDMGFNRGAFSLNGQLPRVRPNVQLIKGWFTDTLPLFLEAHPGPITFLHVDCDIYSSTKTIFDLVASRISDGCIILFDELINYPGFQQHEWKAWWEFVESTGLTWEWIGMNGDVQLQNIRDRNAYDQKVAVRVLRNPAFDAKAQATTVNLNDLVRGEF